MDEYFVTSQPASTPPPERKLTKEDVEKIDLSAFHEPYRTPRSLLALGAVGKTLLAVGMVAVAAVPVLLILAGFRFLESLPW